MKETYSKDDLIRFVPRHDVLVAIDSDGCVFDSMTIKQRIFHTELIKLWGLEAAEAEVRQVAEWVSLYSPWRGLNRFQLLLEIFQSLGNYVALQGFASQGQEKFQSLEEFVPTLGKQQATRRCRVPSIGKTPVTKSLEAFVKSGVALSADELAKRIEQTGDEELQKVLDWSMEVSRQIAVIAEVPVFDGVAACGGINFHPPSPEASAVTGQAMAGQAGATGALEKIRECADAIVVSQTDEAALVREWRNAGLEKFIDVIAGAELGSKIESLGAAMKNRYVPEKTLMVGDAPGDLETALATGSLFFPIIPGDGVASWIELREDGLDRLLNGTFAGDYQDDLIVRFNTALSDTPPWI